MNAAFLNVEHLAAFLAALPGGAPEGVIFDCDGVLVDSCPANIRYYNLLREGVGLPPMTPAQERYVHMSTARQAVEAIIPPALLSAMGEVARRIDYDRDIRPLMLPHEGLHDFLDACRIRGLRLGVHTNRNDGMAALLRDFRLEGYFDPVMTVAVAPPKPDPEGSLRILRAWALPPERVVFVGDSQTDQQAAARAGIPFLGFRAPDLGPAAGSFADLRAALEAVRP